MFITAAYGANLTSYMVVTAKSRLVLNTIQDAIENDMSMCIETMTNQEAYITRKYPDAISLLVPKESVRDMYTALNEGECDVVLGERHDYDAYTLKNEFNPDCHLTWQGRPVLESDSGFATLMDPGQKCTLLVSGKHNIFDDTFVFMKLRRPLTCLFSLFHTSKRGVYISLREAKRGWNLSRIMEHGSRE